MFKRGYFVLDRFDNLVGKPPKNLRDGKAVEIVEEVNTLFGLHYLIRTEENEGKEDLVPEKSILLKTNKVFIAESDHWPTIDAPNDIKTLRITKTQVVADDKIIVPYKAKLIANKVMKVICWEGNTYFILNKFIKTQPFGYVGRAFDGPPQIGENFSFMSVLPFPWSNNRTRRYMNWITIYGVYYRELIGENFYMVKGLGKNRQGNNYVITAYVTL